MVGSAQVDSQTNRLSGGEQVVIGRETADMGLGSERHGAGSSNINHLRGRGLGALDRAPNRQGAPGRKCPVCGTLLSRYNRAETCWVHTEPSYGFDGRAHTKFGWRSHGTDMRHAGCRCARCMAA